MTHDLKLYLVHEFPLAIFVGSRIHYRSGYPYNQYGSYLPGPDGEYNTADDIDHTDPLYGEGVLLQGDRGSYRYPDFVQIVLSIQKDVSLGRWGMMTAIIDIIDLFNNQVVLERDEDEGANFGKDLVWNSPSALTFQLKYSF
ncbi:hypothetical protein JXQ70_06130 [bacterium]|nr:hypothetical protein [bacterium]